MTLICKEDLIDRIRKMMDIDGFRKGEAVSRRAVIAVIDAEKAVIRTDHERAGRNKSEDKAGM